MNKVKNYFPLLIEYSGDNFVVIVKSPEEIIAGKTYRVLETTYLIKSMVDSDSGDDDEIGME